jgi:hypothetical protein
MDTGRGSVDRYSPQRGFRSRKPIGEVLMWEMEKYEKER